MTDTADETAQTPEATPENTAVTRDEHGRWLPGKSPNPGGRGARDAAFKAAAQDLSLEALETLARHMRSADAAESIPACRIIIEHAHGKPRQAVELSADPERPAPTFGISFLFGGPGNPISPDAAAAAEAALPPSSEFGVETSGDEGSAGECDEPSPLGLPEPSSLSAHASLRMEAGEPQMPPDPAHPTAVTIDAHDGAIWEQLAEPPSETRGHAHAKRETSLEKRHRLHQEINEAERQRALEAQRVRAAKLRGTP
jgi:hypothetical protein